MEWEFGMPVQTVGYRLILLGPGGEIQVSKRTSDDLPVELSAERSLYASYGKRFGWDVLENQYDLKWVDRIVNLVKKECLKEKLYNAKPPPEYIGPQWPRVVALSDAQASKRVDGTWTPFSLGGHEDIPPILGDNALSVGWTDIQFDPHEAVKNAPLVLTFGEDAFHYAARLNGNVHHFPIPYELGMIQRMEPEVRERHIRRLQYVVADALE